VLVAVRQENPTAVFSNMPLNFPKDKNLDDYTTNIVHLNNMNTNFRFLKEEI
jgi:hypothetical protein